MILKELIISTVLALGIIILIMLNPAAIVSAQSSTLAAILTWTNSETIDGVQVDKAPSALLPFAKLATVPAGSTTYTDATNSPGTSPCYRVEYFNSSGQGAPSNVVCKTFPAIPATSPTLTVQ